MYAIGLEIGKLNPVEGFLLIRRDLAAIAEQFETCEICRRDIEMSREFDFYMLRAKAARSQWAGKQRWHALTTYARFQVNIIRGVLKWVPEIKWAILLAGLGIAAITLHFLSML